MKSPPGSRRLLSAACAMALLFGLAGTVLASKSDEFTLQKACPHVDDPAACDIVSADPLTMLVGGQIHYLDRVWKETWRDGSLEIARVNVVTGDGKGAVIGQIRFLGYSGLFTWSKGTGTLAGLHASGTIEFVGTTSDGRWLYELAGTYHIDPAG
jgi:hypothetical protein